MQGTSASGPDAIMAALGELPGRTPVSEVAERLLALFTGGSIAPGTRLPPERQLSSSLGVGRSAVREALAAFEILGIVEVRPGSGTYLRGTASDLLPRTLRWGLLIGERSTTDLLELRSGLETQVARLAATRADDDTVARLETQLAEMTSASDTPAAFVEADHDFHTTLARAAGNAVVLDLLEVSRSLLRVYADRAVHDEADIALAVREHAAILDAVNRRDADAAASAMAVHMSSASQRVVRDAEEVGG